MPALDELKAFALQHAEVSLWTFRRRSASGRPPSYTGRWVETTPELDTVLKQIVSDERERISEVLEYGLLAQNNESSALVIPAIETHAGLIVDHMAAETADLKVSQLRHIQNSDFYVIKLLVPEENSAIYAVRKADSSWGTRRGKSVVTVFFGDQELDVDNSPRFDIAKGIDFFIVGDTVLVSHKNKFESVVSYKQAHKDDFADLQTEPTFLAAIADVQALVTHVGDNKIQLRRASAIRQKGHYKNAAFMAKLRENCTAYGLTIQFDDAGRIVPTPETCADIFIALLDHRLFSIFSESLYDVQDATPIGS